MNKRLLLLLSIVFTTTLQAQFINHEAMRVQKDSSGFAGTIGLNVALIKNTSTIFTLGNTIYVQYRKKNHLIFFINSLNIKRVNEEDIIDKGTQHLRYNYKINEKIVWEAFAQTHYNTISKIDARQLIGTGPRFRVLYKEKYDAHIGTLVMYEHEKINEEQIVYNDDFRFSGYLTFQVFPVENISFTSTTYYQPRLDEFSDYRIYSQNSIMFKVIKNLSIGITYTATFDTEPAIGIPKFQYRLLNGISYSFN